MIEFYYRNHRGELARRKARPISIRYGISDYYKENCWLMLAYDIEKQADREFRMKNMTFVEGLPLEIKVK